MMSEKKFLLKLYGDWCDFVIENIGFVPAPCQSLPISKKYYKLFLKEISSYDFDTVPIRFMLMDEGKDIVSLIRMLLIHDFINYTCE